MTDQRYELSRRRALAATGTVGATPAGAGVETSAYFADAEVVRGTRLVAGESDPEVSYAEHYSDRSVDETDGVPVPGNGPTSDASGSNRDCYSAAPSVHAVGVGWYLPVDRADGTQPDSVASGLGPYTGQCRHDHGNGRPSGETATTTPTPR